MTQALASARPAELTLNVLDRTARGFAAATLGFGSFSLYAMAVAFALVAAMDPIVPDQVGFWLAPFKFGLTIGEALPAGPELLGSNIVPVGAALAIACWLLARPLGRGAALLLNRSAR
ncbi:hypothetical protein [Caulobacter sp. 17J80-11]|uniref:hypothetical protein n=1 Tax=Caulobacter sp. 17J80-11 TaxID=2763502 RepID=UPI001653EBC7|nr:hypothetical protein [Caulobacter sp. 17J80-11]MBC6982086.1 hypothetical protein [Caulobacter sp. 17J80-11]